MSRAYLRLDPGFFDRKAIDQKYPPGAVAALVGALCHAEHQPQRGRFRDERVLRSLLGPLSKWVPFLIAKRDLVKVRGQLYVDGWDEWQEGDWKVGERVKRIRSRQKADAIDPDVTVGVTPDVTVGVTVPTESSVTDETVYNLSDGDRQSVIDSGSGSGKRVTPTSDVNARNGKVTRQVKGFSRVGDVATDLAEQSADWTQALTVAERDEWSSFGPQWDAFRTVWLARGFRHPPSGSDGDDPDAPNPSQRALLWSVLDAWPNELARWIAESPKRLSASQVVAHVIERWHGKRDEGSARAVAQEVADTDRDRWLGVKT
jgi:hypothetical protein